LKRTPALYWKIFISTFTLSAFTFGGGYVIVPLMQKKFVNQYGWIDETEMLDMVAIAQSAPGPIAVNASIIIGYRLGGVLGAMVSMLGTVLPPFVIIAIISFFYQAFRDNYVVATIMKGMQAGVAAVIVDAVIKMAVNVAKEKSVLSYVIMFAAFIVAYFFDVNVVFIILACAAVGILATVIRGKRKKAAKEGGK
jgi:chromate transporter